jgi:hypothetical protein
MAPPEHPFPVSALEQRVQYHTVDFKEKSRKLGDFDLKRDCQLLELVQYSCTTPEEQAERLVANPDAEPRMECHPFVRLFRRYEAVQQQGRRLRSDRMADVRRRAKYFTSRPRHGRANMLGNERQARGQQPV